MAASHWTHSFSTDPQHFTGILWEVFNHTSHWLSAIGYRLLQQRFALLSPPTGSSVNRFGTGELSGRPPRRRVGNQHTKRFEQMSGVTIEDQKKLYLKRSTISKVAGIQFRRPSPPTGKLSHKMPVLTRRDLTRLNRHVGILI
jgi:hypothetical protein